MGLWIQPYGADLDWMLSLRWGRSGLRWRRRQACAPVGQWPRRISVRGAKMRERCRTAGYGVGATAPVRPGGLDRAMTRSSDKGDNKDWQQEHLQGLPDQQTRGDGEEGAMSGMVRPAKKAWHMAAGDAVSAVTISHRWWATRSDLRWWRQTVAAEDDD